NVAVIFERAVQKRHQAMNVTVQRQRITGDDLQLIGGGLFTFGFHQSPPPAGASSTAFAAQFRTTSSASYFVRSNEMGVMETYPLRTATVSTDSSSPSASSISPAIQ